MNKATLHKLVIEAIRAERVRVSFHVVIRMGERNLLIESIIESALRASIFEVEIDIYYKGYYDPTCTVTGTTKNGVKLASVWAYNKESKVATLITAYFSKSWFSNRIRR
jgi:hypothetical protein